jgi:hypothetical protein
VTTDRPRTGPQEEANGRFAGQPGSIVIQNTQSVEGVHGTLATGAFVRRAAGYSLPVLTKLALPGPSRPVRIEPIEIPAGPPLPVPEQPPVKEPEPVPAGRAHGGGA